MAAAAARQGRAATLAEVEATDVYSRLGSSLASLTAHSLHGVKQTQTASGWRQSWRRQGSSTATNRQIICVNCEEAMEKPFLLPPLTAPLGEKTSSTSWLSFPLHLFFAQWLCVCHQLSKLSFARES